MTIPELLMQGHQITLQVSRPDGQAWLYAHAIGVRTFGAGVPLETLDPLVNDRDIVLVLEKLCQNVEKQRD